jgi:hypothetical protein
MKLTLKSKTIVRALLVAVSAVLLSSFAQAQFYVRGEFNGWSGNDAMMVSQGDGLYTYNLTGLTPGLMFKFKVTTEGWETNWPSGDARAVADANGEIIIRAFDNEVWTDGWLPGTSRRVGYTYAGAAPHGWELVGSMTSWGDNPILLTPMGNGLFAGDVLLGAGTYDYKFRMAGNWDINLGNGGFANDAGNLQLSVLTESVYTFQLDVANGRFTAAAIPEPSTYAALLGLGVLGLVVWRRRRSAC